MRSGFLDKKGALVWIFEEVLIPIIIFGGFFYTACQLHLQNND